MSKICNLCLHRLEMNDIDCMECFYDNLQEWVPEYQFTDEIIMLDESKIVVLNFLNITIFFIGILLAIFSMVIDNNEIASISVVLIISSVISSIFVNSNFD